jgi:hypothetical protein
MLSKLIFFLASVGFSYCALYTGQNGLRKIGFPNIGGTGQFLYDGNEVSPSD